MQQGLTDHHQQTVAKMSTLTNLVADHLNNHHPSFLISQYSDWIAASNPVRQALSSWNQEIKIASNLATDNDQSLLSAIRQHKNWIQEQHQQLRTLSLQIQRSINQSNLDQRRSLLEIKQTPQNGNLQTTVSADHQARNLAAETTATLQRMTKLMSIEVEKSTINLSALDSQTRLLRNVNQQHSSLTSAIRGARSLLTDLESRDRTDKIIIAFACLVFTSVCFHIIKKRVFGFLIPDFYAPDDQIILESNVMNEL